MQGPRHEFLFGGGGGGGGQIFLLNAPIVVAVQGFDLQSIRYFTDLES